MAKPPPPPKRPKKALDEAGTRAKTDAPAATAGKGPSYELYEVKLTGVLDWKGWIPSKREVEGFATKYKELQAIQGPPSEQIFPDIMIETDSQQYHRITLAVSEESALILPRFMEELGIEKLTGPRGKTILPIEGMSRYKRDGLADTDREMWKAMGPRKKKDTPPPKKEWKEKATKAAPPQPPEPPSHRAKRRPGPPPRRTRRDTPSPPPPS